MKFFGTIIISTFLTLGLLGCDNDKKAVSIESDGINVEVKNGKDGVEIGAGKTKEATTIKVTDGASIKAGNGSVTIKDGKVKVGANGVGVDTSDGVKIKTGAGNIVVKDGKVNVGDVVKMSGNGIATEGGSAKTCPQGNCSQSCTSGNCRFTCSGGNCKQICSGANCSFSCSGSGCSQACNGGRCKFSCSGGNCARTKKSAKSFSASCTGNGCK